MPAVITRLRIAGFKSFAEPTSIDILPGLTGIVGPNGCGKSNVVEALRWAMGETSARSLRGGEMDEVIFAGSAARPSRDIAEVVVTLEEAIGLAPAPLQGEHELQVSRQIERGAGSTYRVNGREMRARDVQTMFADIASGARSSAMVSQGRVAFLVDARPEERRSVLEEAAGITGLHARRHEAELRLRAAEANLTRVADLRSSLESQGAALTRQAEAARRYRDAVGELAASEAALLGIMLGRAARAVEASGRAMEAARRGLAAAIEVARDATADEAAAEVAAGEAGGEAARAAALLERARAVLETVRGDEARARDAVERANARLEEVTQDHARAAREAEAADRSAEQLAAEAAALRGRLDGAEERIGQARAAREEAAAAANREADRQTARLRAAEDVSALDAALAATEARVLAITRAIDAARQAAPSNATLEASAAASDQAARALGQARDALVADEASLRAAEDALAALRRDQAAARDAAARANAMREETRARVERIATELEQVRARRAQALAARVGAGSVARANEAAVIAREAADAAATALGDAETEAEQAEAAFQAARDAAATAGRQAREASSALETARDECDRLEARRASLAAEHEAVAGGIAPMGAIETARRAVEDARAALQAGRADAARAEDAREMARADAETARDGIAAARAAAMALRAEIAALSVRADQSDISLLDALKVPAPLERALAAGLGDALASSLDPAAPRHWIALGPLDPCPPLPVGSVAFAGLIDAPAPLSRALSQLGLLDEGVDGAALRRALVPGQVLVGRDGSLFRWDGHTARGGKGSAIEETLRARRRARECEEALAAKEATLPALDATLADALARVARADASAGVARHAIEVGETALSGSVGALTSLQARDATARARADGIEAELARVASLRAEAQARAGAAENALTAAGDIEALTAAEAAARSRLTDAVARTKAARDAVRDADAMLADVDAEARRLAAREAETAALLSAIEPAIERLGAECSQANAASAASAQDADDASGRAAALAMKTNAAEKSAERLRGAVQSGRLALTEAERAVAETRASHETAAGQAREAASRLALLEPEQRAAAGEAEAVRARRDAAAARMATIGPEDGALETARRADSDAQRACAALEADAAQARERLAAIEADAPDAARRRADAHARVDELSGRLAETRRVHAETTEAPLIMAARFEQATSRFEVAEREAAAAAAAASEGASRLAARREARRAADEAAATAREAVLRAEAAERQAAQAAVEIDERVREASVTVEIVPDPGSGAEAEARRRLARAVKARDEIGPVNLLAEKEAEEVAGRLAGLASEADELETAIGRLRGSIGHLNREGRERLQASFVQIDAQFRALFGRMFDGGRAHLALVGSEDPLEAGLEIYAQPPGKKLSTLSLLSGGEQALTALSLIFAVFRCNPAPVCVLDEVDAPLDDANVERFCRLVADMTKETGTRFLVVTHHQLTMANMDRLYGVTMQERGVSRLLSVDLGRAVELVT